MNFSGLLIGVFSFLIIGLFHPVVVKTEYYWGTRPWFVFLLAGVAACIASLVVKSLVASAMLSVFAFSCFWSIKELFEQRERVRKGWFPRNPKRTYPDRRSSASPDRQTPAEP